MIAVTAQTRIWVAREPADFRCGIDGLAQVCRTVLKSDPNYLPLLEGSKNL